MSSSNSSPMYKIVMDDPLDLRKGAEVHVDFSHAMDKVKLPTGRLHEINVKLLRTMKWGFDLVVQRRQRRAVSVLDELPSQSLFKRSGKKGGKQGGKQGGKKGGKKGSNNDINGGMVSKKTARKSTRCSGRKKKDKRQPSKEEGEIDKQLSKTAKGAKEDEQPEVNQDRT